MSQPSPIRKGERVPICLLLDDCAPVNPSYWHDPAYPHALLVPNAFWREFASLCREHGVMGKCSVLPCPLGVGRIDQGIRRLPRGHLEGYLRIMREDITPRFDITPELVTHDRVLNTQTGRLMRCHEDAWIAGQKRRQISDYLAFGLRILRIVGLGATGVTSPWTTGSSNERAYAAAIGDALWRVNRVRCAWYFLHTDTESIHRVPTVACRSSRPRRVVVSLASLCDDFLWETQFHRSRRSARAACQQAMDAALSPDGAQGRLRDLHNARVPILFHSHAQSLFSNGTYAGLKALEEFLGRVERAFGEGVRWMKCSQLARSFVGKEH